MLSSHSRLHGSHSYRVPWLIDEESVDILRDFTRLKATLMPYVFQAAVVAHTEGVPVLRPMVIEFPDDPACASLDRQFMLGSDVLVAPVFNADGIAEYYLPDGAWTHLLTGEVYTGGRWVREACARASVPVFARPNSVIPTGARHDRADYSYVDGVTLNTYQVDIGTEITTVVPDLDGSPTATFVTSRVGDVIRVTRSGGVEAPWSAAAPQERIGSTAGEVARRASVAAGIDECELSLT